jgi:hypothetical protein
LQVAHLQTDKMILLLLKQRHMSKVKVHHSHERPSRSDSTSMQRHTISQEDSCCHVLITQHFPQKSNCRSLYTYHDSSSHTLHTPLHPPILLATSPICTFRAMTPANPSFATTVTFATFASVTAGNLDYVSFRFLVHLGQPSAQLCPALPSIPRAQTIPLCQGPPNIPRFSGNVGRQSGSHGILA